MVDIDKLKKRRIIGYVCIIAGVIITIFSWIVLFDYFNIGGFILLLILGIVVAWVGIVVVYKCTVAIYDEKELLKYIENSKKSSEICKKYDLEKFPINNEFKEKYGITFLEFISKVSSSKNTLLFAQGNETYETYQFVKIDINGKIYMLVYFQKDSNPVVKLLSKLYHSFAI